MNESVFGLQGRVALITGAAQGIGAVLSRRLSQAGAAVAVIDLQVERGEALVRELTAKGGKATFVKADITRAADMNAAVAATVERLGSLDILVNNARPMDRNRKAFPDSLAAWDLEHDIMLRSPAHLVGSVLPHLERSGRGVVLNIASVVAFTISHGSCGYHAAKAAVVHLTRYLAHELGPRGVRVNCLCPGIVDRDEGTKFTDDPASKAVTDRVIPLKRAGTGLDIGHAAVFLCSEAAAYITGQTLVVDGGLTLGLSFDAGMAVYRAAKNAEI
jgi:NAD(P)-dependent dehydrogenase (short-subunit alcohol dehydrogenase family)